MSREWEVRYRPGLSENDVKVTVRAADGDSAAEAGVGRMHAEYLFSRDTIYHLGSGLGSIRVEVTSENGLVSYHDVRADVHFTAEEVNPPPAVQLIA